MSYEVILLSDMSQSNIWSRPLAPYRLATELRANGFSTLVVNGISDFLEDELVATLENKIDSETLFVGVSSTFVNSRTARGFFPGLRAEKSINLSKVILRIKEKFPHVQFVIGGANTAFFLASESAEKIDFFVFGYSDLLILQIARHYKFKEKLTYELTDGLKIIKADNEKNSSGIVQYQSIYSSQDQIFENETLVLELSRGCRFKCKFCAYPMNGRKKDTFLKDAETLKLELLRNYELYNITNYILADDTYNESLEKIVHFSGIFQSLPFKINFATYLRLDLIHQYPESMDILQNSGLGGAFFGIESLYEPAARAIGKGLSSEKSIATLKKLKQVWGSSVNLTGGFIVGLPNDTSETMTDWLSQISDSTFPLDHASVNPLMIGSKTSQNPWKSEIQLQPEKFGYSVRPDENAKRKDVHWENSGLNSEYAKALVLEHYKKYFETVPRPYDSFSQQALKGYSLPKQIGTPLVNNLQHRDIIDAAVAERALEYKRRINL